MFSAGTLKNLAAKLLEDALDSSIGPPGIEELVLTAVGHCVVEHWTETS